MQGGHRTLLNVSLETGAHDELISFAKSLNKAGDLAKIIGAVGVAHQDVWRADKRDRVDVGATESALGSFQDAGAMRQSDLRRHVRRAVDNQNLAVHTGGAKALLAPVHKISNRDLLIIGWNDDR